MECQHQEKKKKKSGLPPLPSSSLFSSHSESSQRQQGVELVAFADQQRLPGGLQGRIMRLPGQAEIKVDVGHDERLLHWSGLTAGLKTPN